MPLVVDASVAVKWVLPDADSDRALRLILRGDLAAPDLLRLEVAHVLWRQVRRRAMTPGQARRGWGVFSSIPVILRQMGALVDAALDLAIRYRVTVYDGTYLALALALDCPLVTVDTRLLAVGTARTFRRRVLRLEDLA